MKDQKKLQRTMRQVKEDLYDVSKQIREIDQTIKELTERREIFQETYDRLFHLIEVMEKDIVDVNERILKK